MIPTQWLPMFFVPGLALLPLSPSIGTPVDVLKVLAVVALGLVYTAGTVAYSVLLLRTMQGSIAKTAPVVAPSKATTVAKQAKAAVVVVKKNAKPAKAAVAKPAVVVAAKAAAAKAATVTATVKPFTAGTLSFYTKLSILAGAASIYATRTNNAYATPMRTLFVSAYTVMAYVWSARLPLAYVSLVHPLVTTAILILGLAKGWTTYAIPDHLTYLDFFRAYKAGSLHYNKAGAGDLFLYLLGPSVVCFAVSMYSRRALLCSNFLVVLVAMIVSSVGSLFSTAAFCRAILLGGSGDAGRMIRLSILPRNVTTALAMVITELLGGDIGIAVAIVCITGVLGATYGKKMLNFMGIHDPITRGLAIGSSAQGLGVASMVDEPDAFPFAAMSMVLTAISATTLVTIPSFRNALVKVAVGAAATVAATSTVTTPVEAAAAAAEQVIQAAATVVEHAI
jgi:putative effector of murein hydrolase